MGKEKREGRQVKREKNKMKKEEKEKEGVKNRKEIFLNFISNIIFPGFSDLNSHCILSILR